MTRFQKWLRAPAVLAIGQEMPHPRGTIQLLLPIASASRGFMKPVLGTGNSAQCLGCLTYLVRLI